MSRPWMPLYVADYLADTLDLRADENGVYLLMLMIAWRRPDGALPNDMKWLQRALSSCASDMHGNRFNRLVPPLLERFFVLGEDGKFRNKRLTKEREKAEKFSEKQRENVGKRYAANNKNNELEDTNVLPARAEQSQSQSHTHSSLRSEEARASRATRLPDDWMPSEIDLAFAASKGLAMKQIETEAQKFLNYWTSKSGKDATKTNWPRTWENWILNAKGTPNGHGNLNGQRRSASADFFAGIASVAADLNGNGSASGPADEEIPLGRFNIDG